MSFCVRPLTAADLDEALAIMEQSAEGPRWSRHHFEPILLRSPAGLLNRFAPAAMSDGRLAGFAVASVLQQEKLAELETIVVHPDLRRRGIGTALLTACMTYAANSGAACMRLEHRESNRAAEAFYRLHGFHQTGRRKFYYRDSVEDALLLESRLPLVGC